MKQLNGIFLLLGLAHSVDAQQSVLHGTVVEFNSQFETGTRKYLANVALEEDFSRSQATLTDGTGAFRLPLVGIKDGENISYSVKKDKYEVVNLDILRAVAGQTEPLQVYMAPEGKIAENKLRYYNINREAAERALKEKLENLGKKILRLQENKQVGQDSIATLEAERVRLREAYAKIEETARELADRYALTNLDDASPEYQRAFRLFQHGQLDSALTVFKTVGLETKATAIISEQNRNAALAAEYNQRNSEKNKNKSQTMDALHFKIGLHRIKFEIEKITESYTLLLKLDSTDYNTLFEFANFLNIQKQHEKAIGYFKKASDNTRIYNEKAKCNGFVASQYSQLNNRQEALVYIEKALSFYKKNLSNYPTDIDLDWAQALAQSGAIYEELDNYQESEKIHLTYLNRLDTISKYYLHTFLEEKYLLALGIGYNNLGTTQTSLKKFDQALEAYQKSLQVFKRLAEADPQNYQKNLAQINRNLGILTRQANNLTASEEYLGQALMLTRDLWKKNPEAYAHDLSSVLNEFGNLYSELDRVGESKKYFLEALAIQKNLAEIDSKAFDRDLAVLYVNLADIYEQEKDFEQALSSLMQAIEVYDRMCSHGLDFCKNRKAATLNTLGLTYAHAGNFEAAEKYCREAIAYCQTNMAADSFFFQLEMAKTLGNLGLALYEQHRLRETEAAYIEAYDIFDKLAQKKPDKPESEFARLNFNMGNLYMPGHYYDYAEQFFLNSIILYTQLVKVGNEDLEIRLIDPLVNLGVIYFNKNEHATAESYFLQAYSIIKNAKKITTVHKEKIDNILWNMEDLYADWLNYADSEELKKEIREKLSQVKAERKN